MGLNDSDKLIAIIGYNLLDCNTAVLHRFYIRPDLKRHGFGAQILKYVEQDLIKRNVKTIKVHLGEYKYYYESYSFYEKYGYVMFEDRKMKKDLL